LSPQPHPLESPESSSPIVTRAVAAGLQANYTHTYQFPAWQRLGLRLLGAFPQAVARFVISRFELINGLSPQQVANLETASLTAERLADYTDLPDGKLDGKAGQYPAVTVGAALGGASAHLALLLGGPFLPQAFVTTLRGGSVDGNVQTYYERSRRLAKDLADRNPDLITIQHYDPIHDEWMTRYVNHLRFKLVDLPQTYIDFIHQRLQPGGAVCFLDCQASWLRYRLAERSFFQVGGWGDISAQEFLEGSARIQQYGRRVGLKHLDWRLPELPLESGPESEWGSEPGLGEALQEFCNREGYQFVRISLPEPHDFSRLAFYAVRQALHEQGRQPSGVLVEMFSQFDATSVMQAGLLPLWLVFNTTDSLEFLQGMTAEFPQGCPVFFSPLSTFTFTPDLVPWSRWEQALQGLDWRNVGARSSHYPADARALVGWQAPLQRWAQDHSQPPLEPIKAQELFDLAQRGLLESLG
jgi:hypothetical protein